MRFIVAIDWKAMNDGYTFLRLKARTEAQAMVEAPAVACAYGASLQYESDGKKTFQGISDYAGMKDVWCLRLLKQTKEEAEEMKATTTPHIFFPDSYSWKDAEGGHAWCNIDPVNKKSVFREN